MVTDANNHATTHCYDNQNRVIKVLDAKNQAAVTSYTSDNNVQTFTDAANPSSPTNFTYDPTANNLTKVYLGAFGGGFDIGWNLARANDDCGWHLFGW